jgi:hypothetical protein
MALRSRLSPIPVAVLGVRERETLLGYAVLKFHRHTRHGRGDTACYVLDLTTRPGRHDVARALLRGTVQHFSRLRVDSVRYWLIQSPSSPRSSDLWRLGFVAQR